MSLLILNLPTLLLFIILLNIIIFFVIKNYKSNIFEYKNGFKGKNYIFFIERYMGIKNIFIFKNILLLLSFLFLLLNIFEIKSSYIEENNKIIGSDIVFVLDVSKSMNALDFDDGKFKYSRLYNSKKLISDYVIKNNVNRYGLIAFAGDSIAVSPLTTDTNIFLTFLSGVTEDTVNIGGTNIPEAIQGGIDRFYNSESLSKNIIIISDGGEDIFNKTIYKEIKNTLYTENINIITIGVGSIEGNYIPDGKDFFGGIKYKIYDNKKVVTKLNKLYLEEMTKYLDGLFIHLNKYNDFGNIYNLLLNIEKKDIRNNDTGEGGNMIFILTFFSMLSFLMYILFTIKVKND